MDKDAGKVLRSIPWEAAAFGRASGGNECSGTFLSVVAENHLPLLPWLGSPQLLSFPAMLTNLQRALSSLPGDSTYTSPSQT